MTVLCKLWIKEDACPNYETLKVFKILKFEILNFDNAVDNAVARKRTRSSGKLEAIRRCVKNQESDL